MKKFLKAALSLVLCVIMVMGTTAIAFGASVGAVKVLKTTAVSDSAVKLKWSGVAKATGYLLYRYNAATKAWEQKAKTANVTYKDGVVDVATKYQYRVRAYLTANGKTVYGNYSPTLTVLTCPLPVENLKAKVVDGKTVNLTWTAAKGATVYKIFQKLSTDKTYQAIGTSKTAKYTAKYDAAVGTVYYRVQSFVKNSGYSANAALSETVKATLKPGALKDLTTEALTGASVTLRWDEVPGANEYVIYKKDASTESAYEVLDTTKNLFYKVTYPVAPGVAYFRVRPVAKTKTTSLNGTISSSVKVDFKPKKVAALSLGKAGSNSITLTWTAADGASSYRVYEVKKNGKRSFLGETAETSYKITGLASNSAHTYTLRAVADFAGNVQYTAFSPNLTASTIFGKMSALKFSLDSGNHLYILWDQVPGADGYEIEKETNYTWKQVGSISGTTFNATEAESGKQLVPGTDYTYRVRAFIREDGNLIYSDYSEPLTVHSVPGAPKNLKAGTGADHSIVIDWEAVPGAQGYDVYYYNDFKGAWEYYTTTDGYPYNAGDTTRVSYIDKNVEVSGDYQYKVRAVSINDGENYGGKFSDVIVYHYDFRPEPEENYAPGIAESGILGYLYDERQQVFYTSANPWQRNFGFNQFYDIFSQLVMIQYDTMRIQFVYRNSNWMIQPWKGQYGMILYGGEVGVYKMYSERDAQHYDCVKDEDRLMMAMSVNHYDADKKEWIHDFDRPYGTYWWITGFTPGFIRFVTPSAAQSFNNYPDIRLDIRITMKDFEMLNAVTKEMKAMDLTYTVSGLDVYFSF